MLAEVARFRLWADDYPVDRRTAEWECDYPAWGLLYDATVQFVSARPMAAWSAEELEAVLYTIARDNEMQYLSREIRERRPDTLLSLALAAVERGEPDAKWQLAEELGHLGKARREAERLLLILARDADEYVRRRSLGSLARLDSAAVEELALAEWHREGDNQQWSRMNALWSLQRVGSPRLEALLAEAEQDERSYLSGYAGRVRRGQVNP